MDASICALQPFVCKDERPRTLERPAFIRPQREAMQPVFPPAFAKGSHARPRPDDLPSEVAFAGKIVVVFKEYQWMCAYEDGVIAQRDGVELCSPVSTGRRGAATETPLTDPAGKPQLIQWMQAVHCSSEFPHPNKGCDDGGAPMPFTAAIDTDGVAFHAGDVRRLSVPITAPWGESHGCVRLPYDTARVLFFQFFEAGKTQVVITWNPPISP
jgi:hypothetical protein